MRRAGSLLFIMLNILISATVAYSVVFLTQDPETTGGGERLVTFEVIITATPDPNAGPQVIIITATPGPGEISSIEIPDGVREGVSAQAGGPAPTIDPELLDDEGRLINASAALPAGCVEYAIQEGDIISRIAAEYEVPLNTMMLVNGLDEDSARGLQIGQTIIVPLEGCPVDQFIPDSVELPDEEDETESDEEDSETVAVATETPTPTPRPTVTLAPTARDAQLELSIEGAGDITAETVTITNRGSTVDISGWSLSDGDGNIFTFPQDRRLFSEASISVRTSSGTNTAILLHWGRDRAVFIEAGDVIVLRDANGVAQASMRLP